MISEYYTIFKPKLPLHPTSGLILSPASATAAQLSGHPAAHHPRYGGAVTFTPVEEPRPFQQHEDNASELLLPPGNTPQTPSKPKRTSAATRACVDRVVNLEHSPLTDVQEQVLCALKLRNNTNIQQLGCNMSAPIPKQPTPLCERIMGQTYKHCRALIGPSQRRLLAQSREELGTMCNQGRFKTPNRGL